MRKPTSPKTGVVGYESNVIGYESNVVGYECRMYIAKAVADHASVQ